jgi:hypothetical protein
MTGATAPEPALGRALNPSTALSDAASLGVLGYYDSQRLHV